MCGKNSKSGFTLIEILIAFALLGILMSVIAPNFKNLLPRREREAFISKLNALSRTAWQRALIERKVFKVSFDLKKNLFWIEASTGKTKDGQPEFAPVKGAYVKTSVDVPKNIEVKNFIIEGYDEMAKRGGKLTEFEGWFYIMPDGLTQTVTINFVDTKQKNAAGKPRQFGLVLNPFNAQFKTYDSFQK